MTHLENYEFMLTHFCDGSITLSQIPNATGTTGRCRCADYVNGCPVGDPGCGCKYCTNSTLCWVADSTAWHHLSVLIIDGWQPWTLILNHSKFVKKSDLFMPVACNMPYVEQSDQGVLHYMSYRFGLYIDFLIQQDVLTNRRSTLLELAPVGRLCSAR